MVTMGVLNGVNMCNYCGNIVNPADKFCNKCKQTFGEEKKVVNTPQQQPERKSFTERLREKIRYNEPLEINDFISIEKLKRMKKITILQ